MKILLIHPRENIWIRSKTVPLGLGYIASVLEKAGHNVKIIDYRIFPDRELEKADVVGITATTPLIRGAWEIAREAKKKFNAITVLGGPHVSALPEESAKLPYIDYVVRGEGEDTIVQLCSILEQGKSAEQVLGVSFKKDNKIIHHPHREFIKNIDDIPFPAYHLFPPLDKYTNPQPLISERTPAANIMTSRGCPFDCVFCYKGVYGRHYRVRSPENLIAEWKWLIETYNVKEIAIQDDMFNIKLDRAKNICKLIIKENLAIPWSTPNGIRADFFDEELAVLMKEAGCYRIAFGIESGNQDILNSIGKKIKLEDIEKAMKIAKKVNLKTIGFFVMGNPGDTGKTLQDSINFAIKVDPDYAQFSAATPFPGTRLYEIIREKGKILIKDWDIYSQFDRKSYFEYGYINKQLVEKMVKKAYKKFYLRPQKLIKLILETITFKNIFHVLGGALHFIFGWKHSKKIENRRGND